MDTFEVFQTIVREMGNIDKKISTGENKKKFVMDMVREMVVSRFGEEIWDEKYEDVVSGFIEIVIILSKSNALKSINKEIRKCCF